MHSFDIEDEHYGTIPSYSSLSCLPIPEHWENENEMTIFDWACFGVTPNINGHKPDETNNHK